LEGNQYQNLSRFRIPEGARGRPAWFVQLWWLFEAIFVRPTPQVLYAWRRFALRLFGAKIGTRVLIRPGVRVTFPWNVAIGDYCWIGDDATLYSIGKITVGEHSVLSQEAYLCAATHDHAEISFPLIVSPIVIEPECWVAARVFVGPGVTMGRGAVAGAGSVLLSDVPPGTIVAGVPATVVRRRKVKKTDVAD
jgi:putative colanic acid biosynthesis acetyltransferase WcaF